MPRLPRPPPPGPPTSDRLDGAMRYEARFNRRRRRETSGPPTLPAGQSPAAARPSREVELLAVEALVHVGVARAAVAASLRLVRQLQGRHAAWPVECAAEFLAACELSLMGDGSHVTAAELHLLNFLRRPSDIGAPTTRPVKLLVKGRSRRV